MNRSRSPNRLIEESSPYLLQHAHNPVDWRPWNENAFEEAIAENKLVLVSIGYSACHWCHVMERESFEDEEVASIMNAHFVNIKIDREERPDIDQIYMDAVQTMTGSGGWPLNVFLTPEKKPFYGGTYFPPVRAFNRPSWKEVLLGLVAAWKDRREEIHHQADNLTAHLARSARHFIRSSGVGGAAIENQPDPAGCDNIFQQIMSRADTRFGGFGSAPKFPQPFLTGFLFRHYHFTGNQKALDQALLSIDALLNGGIYDHVGGGLARYSTDPEWLAPHFEKMLYDNALLLYGLADAFQLTRNNRYKEAISQVVGFVERELTDPAGGFYSALDADSEGEEGKFYTWSRKEVEVALRDVTDDTGIRFFCRYFDITEAGNWEGTNIVRKTVELQPLAQKEGLAIEQASGIIENGLKKLAAVRAGRVRPGLDDKVILSWNALMTSALARAGAATGQQEYLELAEKNIRFLYGRLAAPGNPGHYLHTWKNNQAKFPAFLDDYALLAEASFQLYQAVFNEEYLYKSRELIETAMTLFDDEEGLFFYYTASGQTDVLVRRKDCQDGAMPSANAIMAGLLLQLGMVFGNMQMENRARQMTSSMSALLFKHPTSFGKWAMLYQQLASGIVEITVLGGEARLAGKQIIEKYYLPSGLLVVADRADRPFPTLAGKKDDKPCRIYLCKNQVCLDPVEKPEDLDKLLGSPDRLQ